MQASNDFTPVEMMIIAAARELKDGEVAFAGTYWPVVVTTFAKRALTPRLKILSEGGIVYDRNPQRVPASATDPCLTVDAVFCGDTLDILGMMLQKGMVDVALLSASNVDRYGNINTTCIGDYHKPRIRLAGSGGACDLASLAKRHIIILEQRSRRFQEKLDYLTSPGYLNGPNARENAGLPANTGPTAVITTMATFRFDRETKEMHLDTVHPGVSVEDVRGLVEWPLKVSPNVKETQPPTREDLRILREEVDPQRIYLR